MALAVTVLVHCQSSCNKFEGCLPLAVPHRHGDPAHELPLWRISGNPGPISYRFDAMTTAFRSPISRPVRGSIPSQSFVGRPHRSFEVFCPSLDMQAPA